MSNDKLTRVLKPYLQVVCNEFGEDIYLAILQDQHVHYIAKIQADLTQHKQVPTSTDDFLYNTAAGKILLSSFLPAELSVYLDQLHESNKLSVSQVHDLNRDLTKTRQDNLSYDLGGQSPDINCVAVGIRNYRHDILASMAVLMQRNEDISERTAAIAERMQDISTELEKRLI
ncbi:IclR family transcriptional regulator domain-containing protein [Secundilactobacillus paracollinoides]|uniref:IclR family transcriptional regulator domain-containing protein n=1 Tax=Secundilactobacillus paracollinoides TaxID=240427 RepID=UPI0009EA2081